MASAKELTKISIHDFPGAIVVGEGVYVSLSNCWVASCDAPLALTQVRGTLRGERLQCTKWLQRREAPSSISFA